MDASSQSKQVVPVSDTACAKQIRHAETKVQLMLMTIPIGISLPSSLERDSLRSPLVMVDLHEGSKRLMPRAECMLSRHSS